MQDEEGNGVRNGGNSNFLDLSISKRLVMTKNEDFEREYYLSSEKRNNLIQLVYSGFKNILSKYDSKIISDAMVIHLRKYAKEI